MVWEVFWVLLTEQFTQNCAGNFARKKENCLIYNDKSQQNSLWVYIWSFDRFLGREFSPKSDNRYHNYRSREGLSAVYRNRSHVPMREKLSTNFDHRLTDDKSENNHFQRNYFYRSKRSVGPIRDKVTLTSEVVEILSADLVWEQSLISKVFITHSIIFNSKSFYF